MISNKSNQVDEDGNHNNNDNQKTIIETKDEQSMTLDKRNDKSSRTPVGDKIPEKETKEQVIESSHHHSDKKNDVTPTEKTKKKTVVFFPVSLLPNISKIFERCMHRQISEYFETVLSKFQCGFRKGYSTQDCLLAMVENCKKALDQRNEYGALLTDLSKAFDCLPHGLIVAKLFFSVLTLECS